LLRSVHFEDADIQDQGFRALARRHDFDLGPRRKVVHDSERLREAKAATSDPWLERQEPATKN